MGAMRKGSGFTPYPCAALRKGSGFTPYPCAALRKGSGVPRAFLLTVSMPRFSKKYARKNF